VGGGRQKTTYGRPSPYPSSSLTTESSSSAIKEPSSDINRRPGRSNSGSISPQSTSSSSQGSPPHSLAPTESPPAQRPARFHQPAFGQSSFGQLSIPQSSFGPLLGDVPSAATSSTISPSNLPRAFMASHEHVSLGPIGDASVYRHCVRPAVTHDRYAPVVVPPPRPGFEFVGGPLPSARRVQNSYDPNAYYTSPFSNQMLAPDSQLACNEHNRATIRRNNDRREGRNEQS